MTWQLTDIYLVWAASDCSSYRETNQTLISFCLQHHCRLCVRLSVLSSSLTPRCLSRQRGVATQKLFALPRLCLSKREDVCAAVGLAEGSGSALHRRRCRWGCAAASGVLLSEETSCTAVPAWAHGAVCQRSFSLASLVKCRVTPTASAKGAVYLMLK